MINESEDKIFDEWTKQHPGVKFAKDGVFGPDRWESEGKQKIVFILKEPNNHHGTRHDWDMRLWKMEKNSQYTWSNIARWGYALRNGNYNISWEKIKGIGTSASHRYENTRGLAILNLNKSGGGANCDKDNLVGNFENIFKSLLTEQIKLYTDVKFAVCCGQLITDCVRKYNLFGKEVRWKEYNVYRNDICVRSVPYCQVPGGPFVIGFVHPNIRQNIIKDSPNRNRDAYEILMEVVMHLISTDGGNS